MGNARGLQRVAWLGALGGGLNATLCYLKWPVPVPGLGIDGPSTMHFHWSIIPGGCAHGAVLAAVPVWFAQRLERHPIMTRWIAVPVIGWLSGWWSWSMMNASMDLGGSGVIGALSVNFWKRVLWPFDGPLMSSDRLVAPFLYFGLVGVLLAAGVTLLSASNFQRRPVAITVGVASGVAGSLWWWSEWNRWWFSLLHGGMWGALVGYGLWMLHTDRDDLTARGSA